MFFPSKQPIGSPSEHSARDDVLWLPGETDGLGVTPIGPQPHLTSGSLPTITADHSVRFWLTDPDRFSLPQTHPALSPRGIASRSPLWSCPIPSSLEARRTSHRAYLLRLRHALEIDAEHGEWATSTEQVANALGRTDSLVLKAPYTAAGRHRLAVTPKTPQPRIEAFLELAKRNSDETEPPGVLLEPWLARVGDYGTVGWITDEGPVEVRGHQLEVNRAGAFSGVASLPAEDSVSERLQTTFRRVADCVHQRGYRGPLGIDSFVYRGPNDEPRWIDLCELNGRLTFGHIAHAWAAYFEAPLARFVISNEVPAASRNDARRAECLLAPQPTDAVGAWIELE